MKKLLIITILMMCFGTIIKAQKSIEVSYSILKNGSEIKNVKEVNSSDMGMLFVSLTHVPDFSGYDLITVVVRFKTRKGSGGFIEYTLDEFMAKLKNSTKITGMKYLLLAVVNKVDNPDNGNGYFTIDEYPFEPFGFKYLFSKEGAGNLDAYQLEFELRGQKIIKYETVWEDGKSITKPVYGDFASLSSKAEITVKTDASVTAKSRSSKVNDANDLKKMFGK